MSRVLLLCAGGLVFAQLIATDPFVSAPQDLGTLGGVNSTATAVNARGQVVGSSDTLTGSSHAFSWTDQLGMLDLGTLAGSGTSYATAVNDQGQVVGTSDFRVDPVLGTLRHAFSWTLEGGMIDLGVLANNTFSFATAVNGRGDVVGSSTGGDPRTHSSGRPQRACRTWELWVAVSTPSPQR